MWNAILFMYSIPCRQLVQIGLCNVSGRKDLKYFIVSLELKHFMVPQKKEFKHFVAENP